MSNRFGNLMAGVGGASAGPPVVVEPIAFIDFINEDYKLQGASVPLSSLLVEDASNWGGHNAATIIPGTGWKVDASVMSDYLVTSSTLWAQLSSGSFTMLVELAVANADVGHTAEFTAEVTDFPNYSAEHIVSYRSDSNSVVKDWNALSVALPNLPNGASKIATTFGDTNLYSSLNGAAASGGDPVDAPSANALGFKLAGYLPDTASATVTKITFIPAEPAANLPALSAGGGLSFAADILRLWDVNQGMTLSSGEVVSWDDTMAGVAMVPVYTATKPNYSATAIKGHPGVTCLNSGEALYSSLDYSATTGTFAAVMSMANAGSAYGRLMSLSDNATASAVRGDEGYDQLATLVRNNSSPNVSVFRNNISTGTHALAYNTPAVLLIDFNGTSTDLYINNVLVGSITGAHGSAALAIKQLGIFYEVASGGNENGQGTVGDIMVVDRSLTAGERAELQSFWAAKFSL